MNSHTYLLFFLNVCARACKAVDMQASVTRVRAVVYDNDIEHTHKHTHPHTHKHTHTYTQTHTHTHTPVRQDRERRVPQAREEAEHARQSAFAKVTVRASMRKSAQARGQHTHIAVVRGVYSVLHGCEVARDIVHRALARGRRGAISVTHHGALPLSLARRDRLLSVVEGKKLRFKVIGRELTRCGGQRWIRQRIKGSLYQC